MNALTLALTAACCSALSSLSFRKHAEYTEEGGNPNGYLLIAYLASLISAFALFPELLNFKVDYVLLIIGGVSGLLTSSLMLLIGRALKYGPAGLTFAFINASAVFPGLVLFLLFGVDYGFSLSYLQLTGMAIVLFGLFLGARETSSQTQIPRGTWLKYAIGGFIVQILALSSIQGHSVLFQEDVDLLPAYLNPNKEDDIWFLPGQAGASLLLQSIICWRSKTKLKKADVFCGIWAGVANFCSTFLLLLASQAAQSFEQIILFPCFAVTAMILCNVWAKLMYKEKFNLTTNAICTVGIFMAAM